MLKSPTILKVVTFSPENDYQFDSGVGVTGGATAACAACFASAATWSGFGGQVIADTAVATALTSAAPSTEFTAVVAVLRTDCRHEFQAGGTEVLVSVAFTTIQSVGNNKL